MDIQTKTDIIHQKIYDFLLYIYPLLTKYPKYEKFSLQTATRNAILEMLQESLYLIRGLYRSLTPAGKVKVCTLRLIR